MFKSGKSEETAVVASVASWQRVLRGGVAVSALALMSTAAQAACTSSGGAVALQPFLGGFAAGGPMAAIISGVTTANTAFLTQSTAFIGSPPNPAPNQQGGGVWSRAIGGQIDTKNVSVASGIATGGVPVTGNITCNTRTQLDFAGFQVGADLGRFNVNGWNITTGATAGYMSSKAKDTSSGPPTPSFTNDIEIPFTGVYAAVTRGGFFMDGQLRFDALQNKLNDSNINTGVGVFNQRLDARTISLTGNVGYNHAFGNQWFIEPSAGFIYSNTEVDPLNYAGTFVLTGTGLSLPGLVNVSDIESLIGRASVRVGTVVQAGNWVVSPFVTGSVYHEFGDAVTSRFTASPTTLGFAIPPITANLTTSTLGTWGQVALGMAAQLPGTGWIGYVRGDYRFGENMEGWSLNGGLRYQYTPMPVVASKMSTKGPAIPVVTTVNWTGVYIGASVGGVFGQQDWVFEGVGTRTSPRFAGVAGGGQIGYNHQVGKWVFGLEADYNATNAKGGRACPNTLFVCEADMDWLATGTGKIGYAFWDRAYVYAKAGVAAGEVSASFKCNTGAQPTLFIGLLGCPGVTSSNTQVGWTAGWGTEFALTENWSARSESKYFDLGSDRFALPTVVAGCCPASVKTDGWISTIGLNYRFAARRP